MIAQQQKHKTTGKNFASVIFRQVVSRWCVKSADTDVLALLVHYLPHMKNTCELWIETGMISNMKNGRRYIPVHEICG